MFYINVNTQGSNVISLSPKI